MDGKEYCNKRVMLGKYRYLMAMVARRGKEAARWNDLAARPVGSGIGSARTKSGAQPVDIGAAKVNALAIEQECDELAEEARRERDRLAICIARCRTRLLGIFWSWHISTAIRCPSWSVIMILPKRR